jgi:hypothetical protein
VAADCYTWLRDDEPAEEHAREIIAYRTRPDGSSNAPMRSANSHMDLAVIRVPYGDLEEVVHHGLAAFGYDRKTETSLPSRAADLDRILSERRLGERLADDFHELPRRLRSLTTPDRAEVRTPLAPPTPLAARRDHFLGPGAGPVEHPSRHARLRLTRTADRLECRHPHLS